jgi:hypothetical protein
MGNVAVTRRHTSGCLADLFRHKVSVKERVVIFLLALACAAPQPAAQPPLVMPTDTALDDTLSIALGASAVTSDNSLRITVRSKLQDSRCAMNVQCVWAGSVGVGLRAETLQSTNEGNVNTNVEPKIFWAGQHQISLLDLTPRPGEASAPTVATLRVVRLGK